MTIHKLPHGLPVPNPTKSYWQTPPLGIADERTTPELPPSTQYVIVGSGISGSLIAYKLLKADPDASIVMLEARQACSGATGRNGGHCRAGRWLSFSRDVEIYGLDDALRMEQLEEKTVQQIGRLIEEESIKCDLQHVETCDIFMDDQAFQEALNNEKARRAVAGDPPLTKRKTWSKEETRKDLLIPDAAGAFSYPAYSLNLQTTTPVLRVSKDDSSKGHQKWKVQTNRGTIRANKVILATNAYTTALYPQLADFLIPTRAQVAAVRPGTNIAGNPALKRTCGIEHREVGEYLQSRAKGLSGEGDIIVGGGRTLSKSNEQPVFDDSTINAKISEYLTRDVLVNDFGDENWGKNGKILQEWTGIMGYTKDSQPIVGEAPDQPGLYLCVGFNGHGMALTYQSTEALVQIARGREKEVDQWFPRSYRISRVLHV